MSSTQVGDGRLIADERHPAGEPIGINIKFAAGTDEGIGERPAAGDIQFAAGVDRGIVYRTVVIDIHRIIIQNDPCTDFSAGNIIDHVYNSLISFQIDHREIYNIS